MNSVSGIAQEPVFQGKYLLRLPGKKGETFLTTIKTNYVKSGDCYGDMINDIVDIKGEGIYKGKKTGETFRYKSPNGFGDKDFLEMCMEIQSKIKDNIDVCTTILEATWTEGRKRLGAMVQVLKS